MLVLDSGGLSRLAGHSRPARALFIALREEHGWPPIVPSVVLVECLEGHAGRDARTNAFLESCEIRHDIPERLARRAALLRRLARRGSAVDALVVGLAEPGGIAVTTDADDLDALALRAERVTVIVL